MLSFLILTSYGLVCYGVGYFFGLRRRPQLPVKSQPASKVRVNNTPPKPTDKELQEAWDEVEKEFPTQKIIEMSK